MAEDVGRPTELDDKLLTKIRDLVLENRTLQEIAEIIEIPWGTFKDWNYRNYKGFSDNLLAYKHERIIRKAEANLEVLLESEDERVQADMTKFSLETLGKSNYSKRSELTGKDGENLIPKPILGGLSTKDDVEHVPINNSNQENSEVKKED